MPVSLTDQLTNPVAGQVMDYLGVLGLVLLLAVLFPLLLRREQYLLPSVLGAALLVVVALLVLERRLAATSGAGVPAPMHTMLGLTIPHPPTAPATGTDSARLTSASSATTSPTVAGPEPGTPQVADAPSDESAGDEDFEELEIEDEPREIPVITRGRGNGGKPTQPRTTPKPPTPPMVTRTSPARTPPKRTPPTPRPQVQRRPTARPSSPPAAPAARRTPQRPTAPATPTPTRPVNPGAPAAPSTPTRAPTPQPTPEEGLRISIATTLIETTASQASTVALVVLVDGQTRTRMKPTRTKEQKTPDGTLIAVSYFWDKPRIFIRNLSPGSHSVNIRTDVVGGAGRPSTKNSWSGTVTVNASGGAAVILNSGATSLVRAQ